MLAVSIAVFITVLGVLEMTLGLVSIAAHAWKANPVLGILCCFIPPVAMYWGLLKFKQDHDEDKNLFVISNYFFGLIFFVLGLVCIGDIINMLQLIASRL
ncbi:hypothetical protein JXA32_06295 [Candidatus Sumerlaeota bacterium]|nr:hypothetical protein [Candidatus Sumerlaeota bacterium]